MTWQRVLFESDDFDVSGKNFQMHGFIHIQIVDLYDLAKGSLRELVNLSEICQRGGYHAHKIVEMLPTY